MKMEEAIRELTEAYINNKCKYDVSLEFRSRGTPIDLFVHKNDGIQVKSCTCLSIYIEDRNMEEKLNTMLDVLKGSVDPFEVMDS